MSFKGLTKAINRLPQHLKEKTSSGSDITSDSDFALVLNSFRVFSTSIDKVFLSGSKYAKQLDVMLKELQNYCENIEDILRGDLAGKKVSSSADNIVTPVEVTSVKTCIEGVSAQLRPYIDQLLATVNKLELVNKANQGIEKTIIKREHKRVDYDRYKADLAEMEKKRANTNVVFSVKDEKKLQDISAKYSQADYEYNTIHSELKQQIPMIISLKPSLVEPILFKMFEIQSIFYSSLSQTLPQSLVNQTLDALYTDMSTADTKIRALESIAGPNANSKQSLDRRTSKDKTIPPAVSQESVNRDPPNKIRPNPSMPTPVHNPFEEPKNTLPLYTAIPAAAPVNSNPWVNQPPLQTSNYSSSQPGIPPKPKVQIKQVTATALFDFSGQESGDLSFKQGDTIIILEKTNTTEDWWKGMLNDKQGMFPANYVRLN
eukprot:NODE_466_length_8129_cov_0.354545.p3 type:complete len:431 gc:universal NODE_466_length_8129_cov_0.354545:6752-8044(+)